MALGLELQPLLHPYVLAGVLFVSVPFLEVVSNQSDALFAGFAALAVSRLLAFRRTHRLSYVTWGSLMVGLAVLSRAEAILLLGLYPILAFAIGFRHIRLTRLAAGIFAPALAVLMVYLVLFRWSTGTADLGFQGKAYDSFETNQSVTTAGDVPAGKAEARRLYGTAEENHNSVFRAIMRNPVAFALRLWASAKTLPDYYLSFFQNQLGPALLLLAFWGIVRLFKAGRLDALAVLALWSTEPLTSIAFLPLHLVPQVSYIILVLGAVGAGAMVWPTSSTMHWLHLGSWAVLALFGLLDAKLALMVAGLLVLLAMALVDLYNAASAPSSARPAVLLLLLLSVGVILRTPFRFPNYTSVGTTSEEQAIRYLESHVPPNSLVMTPYPGPALAARMSDISPGDVPASARSAEAFLPWVHSKGIAAIYLDHQFKRSEAVYDVVDSLAGTGLRVAFETADGRIRVLVRALDVLLLANRV